MKCILISMHCWYVGTGFWHIVLYLTSYGSSTQQGWKSLLTQLVLLFSTQEASVSQAYEENHDGTCAEIYVYQPLKYKIFSTLESPNELLQFDDCIEYAYVTRQSS